MSASVKLVWHQFKKETLEHRASLIAVLSISGVYSLIAAAGLLESIEEYWSYPMLLKNPSLPLFFTLGPAVLLVPFLAFADSCSEPDAFWVTKPLGPAALVGAKILWITVWLIGVPFLGECLVVIALGGITNLGAILFDYILLRATFLFTTFAFACLFNKLLHFTIALFCIPFLGALFLAAMQTFTTWESIPFGRSPTALSAMLIWCLFLSTLAPFIAGLQFRYRLGLGACTTLAIVCFNVGGALAHRSIDLLDHPVPAQQIADHGLDNFAIHVDSATLIPGALSAKGQAQDQLKLQITLTNLPKVSGLLLNRVQVSIRTANRETSMAANRKGFESYREDGNPIERVFQEIIADLKGQAQSPRGITGTILLSLPVGETVSNWKDRAISVTGSANFDLFTYHESGRLTPSLTTKTEARLSVNGNTFVMRWAPTDTPSRYVSIQNRHFSATLAANNHEQRFRWNPTIASHYYILHDRTHDTYWESLSGQYSETCRGPSFCALHLARCSLSVPPDVPLDEVIIYSSHYEGTVTRTFSQDKLLPQQED